MTQKWLSGIGAAALVALTVVIFINASAIEEHSIEDGQTEGQSPAAKDYKVYALPIPKNVQFAGEHVPLNDPEIRERYDREILSNTYFQSQGLLYFKRANRYFPVIEPILKQHNIPDDFKYLALIESGLMNVVSPAGAAGFWQFMKTTGPQYGLEVNNYVDERYHLEKATHAACKYLNDAYKKFDSWALAAAAYNAGSARIEKSLSQQGVTNYFDLYLNTETSRYVFRIMAVKEIIENPLEYGFHFDERDLYNSNNTYDVQVNKSIPDLAGFAIEHGITYKLLKHYNPWLRSTMLPVNGDKQYTITLPKKGVHHVMSDIFENESDADVVIPSENTDTNE